MVVQALPAGKSVGDYMEARQLPYDTDRPAKAWRQWPHQPGTTQFQAAENVDGNLFDGLVAAHRYWPVSRRALKNDTTPRAGIDAHSSRWSVTQCKLPARSEVR